MKKIFLISIVALTLVACEWDLTFKHIVGNGNVQQEEREITQPFNSVKVSTGIYLELIPGTTNQVVVEADENLLDYIVTRVEDGELRIYAERMISGAVSKKVQLTYTDLEAITTTSGAHVSINTPIVADNLHVKSSSGSTIRGTVYVKDLSVKVSSGADISLSGQSKDIEVSASSGSTAQLRDLECLSCHAKASSGADAKVFCKDFIQAKATSGGVIKYYGNPKQVNNSNSKSGSVYQG